MTTQTEHAAEAARELRGTLLPDGNDELSRGTRAIAPVLIAVGVPIERASDRARNLAQGLADGEEDVLPAVRESLADELRLLEYRVTEHVARAWLRATGRGER